MKELYFLLALLFLSTGIHAQSQVNAYAQVTDIRANTLLLSQVDETFDSFEDREQILIVQIQDDVLSSNVLNDSSFGGVGQLLNAGNFEIAQISSHTESSGTLVSITLQNPLINTYSTGPNSRLQIVSFPQLGSPNYTTTTDMTAKAWDGTTGGILAFEVTNKLTVAHNISVDGLGFRGGAVSRNAYGAICSGNAAYISSSDEYGAKGEGIYVNNSANYTYGRAKLLNGGGGGSHHNGGGGGGGNYTTGGEGGRGYNGGNTVCPPSRATGGQGGMELSNYIALNRVFLGGGGGGGQQNNSRGTSGANGGGLIYIKAPEIVSSAGCSGIAISANGDDAASWTNDGAGGGGAGGSILLAVNNFNINSSCPLVVEANGGDGGSSLSTPHGGGGGGGQGVIFYSNIGPLTHGNSRTLNGQAGCNSNRIPCNNLAGIPSGMDNEGIFEQITLPLELVYFEAKKVGKTAVLQWGLSQEDQTAYFEVQRSTDAINFETLAEIPTQTNQNDYEFLDEAPPQGQTYYRIRQVESNDDYLFSELRSLYFKEEESFIRIYPNPAKNKLYLELNQKQQNIYLDLLDAQGRKQSIQYQEEAGLYHIYWDNLPEGIYFLQITAPNFHQTQKVQIY